MLSFEYFMQIGSSAHSQQKSERNVYEDHKLISGRHHKVIRVLIKSK